LAVDSPWWPRRQASTVPTITADRLSSAGAVQSPGFAAASSRLSSVYAAAVDLGRQTRKGRVVVKRLVRVVAAGTATIGTALLVSLPAGAAGASTACTDVLSPGTYQKVVVPAGAVCLSEGPVTVRGGLFIEAGATFVLGSEENPVDTGTISGGVHATNPASVQIHFTTINGGIDVRGGSGPFGGPFDITGNAREDNQIHGRVTVDGYDGFWFGFIRNTVRGAVNLNNNVLLDPDGNEYVTNTIYGSLNCAGNSPAPQVGDSEGSPNQVTGRKTGQCANL
jgi:hypothetical protein